MNLKEEKKIGMTYEQFVKKYLENDPYEFMAHIDAMWASLPADPESDSEHDDK